MRYMVHEVWPSGNTEISQGDKIVRCNEGLLVNKTNSHAELKVWVQHLATSNKTTIN